MILVLAWRSFLRQLFRFQVILTTLVLGVAAMVVLIGVSSGLAVTLREKAARYFVGDVAVYSLVGDRSLSQQTVIRQALETTPGFQSLCRRTEYYGGDSTLFYGGDSIRQRKLVGVDWAVEGRSFRSLDWVSGGPLVPGDQKGIVLSLATADRLRLVVGDEVIVSFLTLHGQRNSLSLLVRGVFSDTSFFGYASYVDIEALNAGLGYEPGTVTAMGAILKPDASAPRFGARLVRALDSRIPTHELVADRAEQTRVMANPEGKTLAVMTLDANLADINDILGALFDVSLLASGLFLLILMIGVGNTYRMIVFERTQEIGTMRALGVTKARLVGILLAEAGVLGVTGLILGTVVGGGLLQLASVFDWSGNSLIVMFLNNGHLAPLVPAGQYGVLTMALLLTTLLGACLPAIHAARLRPVDALREGE